MYKYQAHHRFRHCTQVDKDSRRQVELGFPRAETLAIMNIDMINLTIWYQKGDQNGSSWCKKIDHVFDKRNFIKTCNWFVSGYGHTESSCCECINSKVRCKQFCFNRFTIQTANLSGKIFLSIRSETITKTNTLPIELLIATTISFNCLVENPTARVDLNRFHLGMSDKTSSVCPNIGPAPIEPPPGTRVGKEPKCVANVSRISSSSTVRIVGVVAR